MSIASRLSLRLARRLRDEHGFTMIVAMGVLLVTSLLITATFVALSGDAHNSQNDLNAKRAYYAARAGVDAFTYQMNENANYWTSCTNDTQSTMTVPGSTTGETYAWAPVPANGGSTCSVSDPIGSLIDTTTGTLRMKFTGTSGGTPSVSRGIIAQYRKASPLDYLWFTQYEALDSSISGYTDCAVYYRVSGGRPSHCNIYWVSGDTMKGPMYTMDQFLISGSPTFGRNTSDYIRSLAPGSICSAGCGSLNMQGTPQAGYGGVSEPSDNSGLLTDATNHGLVFSGTTQVMLGSPDNAHATIVNCPGTSATAANCTTRTVLLASTPIIYVSNATGCNPPAYNPFGATYPATGGGNYYGCAGDVYVSGNYNSSMTIAAANDIVINGNLLANGSIGAPSGSPILGLVANEFVRLMHGVSADRGNTYLNCGSNTDILSQTLKNPTIDAAILALQHSFIVDNFDCGNPANTVDLNIYGALAQRFRGAVGTGTGNTGYIKDYSYDDRLAVLLPPYLFDISTSAWELSRETLCVPGGSNANTQC